MSTGKKSNNKQCNQQDYIHEDSFLSESWVQVLNDEEPPSLLHASIMQAIEEEKRREKMRKWTKRTKWISGIAAAVVVLAVVVSTGLNGGNSYDYAMDEMMTEADMDYGYSEKKAANFDGMDNEVYADSVEEVVTEETMEAPAEAPMDGNQTSGAATTTAVEQRKIIQNADIYMETLEFDTVLDELQKMVSELGGYIESSEVSGRPIYNSEYSRRSAWYTLRIPVKYFNGFVNDMQDVGNVISKRLSGTDITASYFDTEARLESLTIQEDRLLAILEKAEKLEDVIELERELANVRYEIESLTGTLRRWDNLVDYATVNLSIDEVRELKEVEPEPETWGQRIANEFKSSINRLVRGSKNFVVGLVGAIPFIIVFAVVALMIVLPVRAISLKRKNKKQLKGESENEEKN